MFGFQQSNDSLMQMIEGVDEILQIYMQTQFPVKQRVVKSDLTYLQKIDHKMERLKIKYLKMEREYKRLQIIYMNSEHRKKEKDLITMIKVQEGDLANLRDHHQSLLRYNELHT